MNSDNTRGSESKHDVWTIGAIAALAYIVANVLHEGLGHGGACWQVGGHPRVMSTVHFDCGYDSLASWKPRWVSAAGVVINAVAGGFFYLAWRFSGNLKPALKYFLLLCSVINLFMAGGYLLFLYPFGLGDGDAFADLSWVLRPMFAAAGFFLYFFIGKRLLAKGMTDLIDFSDPSWRKSAEILSKVSYGFGCCAVSIPGLLNPVGMKYFFGSAVPATFFGTIGLLKIAPSIRPPAAGVAAQPLIIDRSFPWLCVAALIFILYAVFLGPGWVFR